MATYKQITRVEVVQSSTQVAPPSIDPSQMSNPGYMDQLKSQFSNVQQIQISFRYSPGVLDIDSVLSFTQFFNVQTGNLEPQILKITLMGGMDEIYIKSTYADFEAWFTITP